MEVVRRGHRAGERLAYPSRPPTNRNMAGGSTMHPGNNLAVGGLANHLESGCSLKPAYMHLSLVASARVVGHAHGDENVANCVLCVKCAVMAKV